MKMSSPRREGQEKLAAKDQTLGVCRGCAQGAREPWDVLEPWRAQSELGA
jgi:hypothetical protein